MEKRAKEYDPLSAQVHVGEHVESWTDQSGLVKVERTIPAAGKVGAWLENRFGMRKSARVNLDEHGSAFWLLIDGKRSLLEIEKMLRKKTGVDEQVGRSAVMAFTKMLMKRNLINLYVKPPVAEGK